MSSIQFVHLLVLQVSFAYQVAGIGRGWAFHYDPGMIISNCKLTRHLENLWNHSWNLLGLVILVSEL